MFEDLSIIFGWQTAVLCCAIYAIVFVTRKVLEGIPVFKLAANKYWRDIVLPILPIVFGVVLGCIPTTEVLYPGNIGLTLINRIIFGAVAGLFSSWVYAKVYGAMTSWKIVKDEPPVTETTTDVSSTATTVVTTTTIAPADVADISGK